VVLTSLLSVALLSVFVSTAGATRVRMSPQQVAEFALRCAGKNKVTTYFDIKCAAVHSTNVSLVTGVVGGPTEYPEYSAIGFLLNNSTGAYSCYAYPDKVGAKPVNITNDCPLWLIFKEYDKTNFPLAYAIASSFVNSPPPTLDQVQSVAATTSGAPSVSAGSGTVYSDAVVAPASTFRMSYESGVGRDWCLWFFPATDASGQPVSSSLIGPPGMYGTC
jgi:hypothetical protein